MQCVLLNIKQWADARKAFRHEAGRSVRHCRREPGVRFFIFKCVLRLLYERGIDGGLSEVEVLVQSVSRNKADAVVFTWW